MPGLYEIKFPELCHIKIPGLVYHDEGYFDIPCIVDGETKIVSRNNYASIPKNSIKDLNLVLMHLERELYGFAELPKKEKKEKKLEKIENLVKMLYKKLEKPIEHIWVST